MYGNLRLSKKSRGFAPRGVLNWMLLLFPSKPAAQAPQIPRFVKRSRHPTDGSHSSLAFHENPTPCLFNGNTIFAEVRTPPILRKVARLCTERRAKKSRYCSSRANLGYRCPRFSKRSRHPNDGSRSCFDFPETQALFSNRKTNVARYGSPRFSKKSRVGVQAPPIRYYQ